MTFIPQEIAPIQAETVEELRREVEIRLREMQQQIYLLRQFLEPAVESTDNTPSQVFNPLE